MPCWYFSGSSRCSQPRNSQSHLRGLWQSSRTMLDVAAHQEHRWELPAKDTSLQRPQFFSPGHLFTQTLETALAGHMKNWMSIYPPGKKVGEACVSPTRGWASPHIFHLSDVAKDGIIPILVPLAIATVDELWSKNKKVERPVEKIGRPMPELIWCT